MTELEIATESFNVTHCCKGIVNFVEKKYTALIMTFTLEHVLHFILNLIWSLEVCKKGTRKLHQSSFFARQESKVDLYVEGLEYMILG